MLPIHRHMGIHGSYQNLLTSITVKNSVKIILGWQAVHQALDLVNLSSIHWHPTRNSNVQEGLQSHQHGSHAPLSTKHMAHIQGWREERPLFV